MILKNINHKCQVSKTKNLTQNSGTNERNENIGHNIGTVTQDHFEGKSENQSFLPSEKNWIEPLCTRKMAGSFSD